MTSLRFRIIISTLLIIFLIIAGSYLVIRDIQTGIIERDFRDKGMLLANHLALEITTPFLINNLIEVRNSVEDMKNSYPDIEYVFITDSEGIVLVHTFEGGFPKALWNMSKPENAEEETVYNSDRGVIHEFDAPIFKNTGYVHIGVSENRVRAQINEASRKLLMLAAGAMVLGAIFTYYIGRRLTEPVLLLTEGANRINKGILDLKINISSNDELSELARTLNDMASSLDQKIKDLVASKEQTETAQNYLETLFDSIDDGIIVVNTDHEIVKTNKSFLKMMGKDEEEIKGKSCHELIFRNDLKQKEECPIETLLQTRNPVRFVHEATINGNKKILEINASPFLDKRNITNIILVMRDVTAQKMLEDEIIARNRELRVLNDISKTISETLDMDKILRSTLENLSKLAGLGCAEVYLIDEKSGEYSPGIRVGTQECCANPLTNCKEVLAGQDKQKLAEIKTEVCGEHICIPLKSKDKKLGIITLTNRELHRFSGREKELFSAIGNQAGVAIENIIFYNNIKYLNEFNEEILNNVNMAIHVVDKDMKILAVNNELIKLGRGRIKKEEIVNKNLFEAFPFLKERHADQEYEYVMEKGEIFQSDEKMEYYDDTIYTSTSKIPIKDRNGNVEKIITVIKDVSEQKRLEEELRDSYEELRLTYSKLKELYQIKENFLSNISHELRTPLTSIMGYTELILEEKITEDQQDKLEIILRNSKKLSRLINMLLDTTVIESKSLQLYLQMVSVHDLVMAAAEDVKTKASIKNIPVYIDVPQLIVEGDMERLLQVFSNVLDNAVKFTLKGEVRIKACDEIENVHIKISDTGIGIPQDELELIFDRFYQGEMPHAQKYGGTGLGLWISKNIVEAHGGKIWAESKNTGSTFHILLPKRRKNER